MKQFPKCKGTRADGEPCEGWANVTGYCTAHSGRMVVTRRGEYTYSAVDATKWAQRQRYEAKRKAKRRGA